MASVSMGMDVLVNGQKRRVVRMDPGAEAVTLEDWPEPVHPSRLDWADGRRPGCDWWAISDTSGDAVQMYLRTGGDPGRYRVERYAPLSLSDRRFLVMGKWKGEP
jgi:hypothetical protein